MVGLPWLQLSLTLSEVLSSTWSVSMRPGSSITECLGPLSRFLSGSLILIQVVSFESNRPGILHDFLFHFEDPPHSILTCLDMDTPIFIS